MQRSTYRFRMFLFYQERCLLPRSVVRDTGRDCARSQSTVLPSGSVPQLYRRHQSPSECRRTMHRSRLQRLHHLYESPPTLSVCLIHLQLNIFSHEFHLKKKIYCYIFSCLLERYQFFSCLILMYSSEWTSFSKWSLSFLLRWRHKVMLFVVIDNWLNECRSTDGSGGKRLLSLRVALWGIAPADQETAARRTQKVHAQLRRHPRRNLLLPPTHPAPTCRFHFHSSNHRVVLVYSSVSFSDRVFTSDVNFGGLNFIPITFRITVEEFNKKPIGMNWN